jgi:hypothetical protein
MTTQIPTTPEGNFSLDMAQAEVLMVDVGIGAIEAKLPSLALTSESLALLDKRAALEQCERSLAVIAAARQAARAVQAELSRLGDVALGQYEPPSQRGPGINRSIASY